MHPVQVLLIVIGVYALLGVAFAAAFLTRGVARMDPAVAGSKRSIRVLLAPGVVALWPVLASKWARRTKEDA